MIGRTVSHYRVLARLGEGGMGVVYKAEDLRLPRTVALKFLPEHASADAGARARFAHEARAAVVLEHSNICRVHDIDDDGGRPFIVMSYLEGRTLRDRLQEGPLPLDDALRVAIQVADALAYAHGHGVVHRDVKPANIMLDGQGHAWLMDFGLARVADATRLTSTGKAVGTPLYMSPEQIAGGDVDGRTDLWSLGAVLFETLTGRPPFVADHWPAAQYAICNLDAPAVSSLRAGVPPQLELVVRRALARDADRRYRSAEELLRDLRALRGSEDRRRPRSWLWWLIRQRPAVIVGLPLLAVAAVLALTRPWAGRAPPSPFSFGRPLQITSSAEWEGEPCLSPDGTRIAFTGTFDGNTDIFVVSAGGGEPVRLTDHPTDDFSPTWFPDGASIAFVSARGGGFDVWKTGQLGSGATALVRDGLDPAISPDGARIAFARAQANGELRIFVAPLGAPDVATQLTRDGQGLWHHRSPAWSPDGRRICYATMHDLWVVPATGGDAHPLLTEGLHDADPAWSPDGRRVYFGSSREGTMALWRVAASGRRRPERLSLGTGGETHPTLDRRSTRLAWATQAEISNVAVLDRRTGRETPIEGSRYDSMPALAPDGSAVAYASDRQGGRLALWVQPLRDGAPAGEPTRLNDQAGDVSHPAYSPDGLWIAYYLIETATQQRDVWIVSATGGVPQRFTESAAVDMQPSWSPDGRQLAFVSERDSTQDIWFAPVAQGRRAGPPVRLTRGEPRANAPAWSPDGRRLAFLGLSGGQAEIWLVAADGSAPPVALTRGAGAQRARWAPDGASLWVTGSWGERAPSLRAVSARTGLPLEEEPVVRFDRDTVVTIFDVSADGTLMAFSRERTRGDLWVLASGRGMF